MLLRDFYRNVYRLEGEQLISELEAVSGLRMVRRGEVVLREGETQKDALLLIEGVFRGYFFDEEGREVTECFAYEIGSPVMSRAEMGTPSNIAIAALADSLCAVLPVAELLRLIAAYPELSEVYRGLLRDSTRYHWNAKAAVYKYSARERVEWFRKTFPGLMELAGGKYVASFLNMTPVTLSRIRSEAREEQSSPENQGAPRREKE